MSGTKGLLLSEDTSLAIIKSIINMQKDLIVIFKDNKIVLMNSALKKFFGVSSVEQYEEEFGPFVHNFVPHPSYFHSQKIQNKAPWYDAILELEEIDRVVSMITPSYEPYAFSVEINKTQDYVIALFSDITQTLIKRIMIENNANIDAKSGAYAKAYFLQIAQSYQDVALLNKKIISAILIKTNLGDANLLKDFVANLKSIIRQDDMLIRWDEDSFLLIYLAETPQGAKVMMNKLNQICIREGISEITYTLSQIIQKEGEEIKSFIKRIDG
jgi:competence protein ComGF